MKKSALGFVTLAALLAMGCGGQDAGQEQAGGTTDTATGAGTGTGAGTATPSGPAVDASTITAEMVSLGNEIFHGRAANGICYTCHGMDATGGPGNLGPNLVDGQWLHADGSYGSIIQVIRTGVAQPVQSPAPMPPMGGASLSDEQLRAVAAYVYSLSHPEAPQASSG